MKKVAKKITKDSDPKITLLRCSTCKYHVLLNDDKSLGNCHRYPQTSKAYNTHWCGEHTS